MTMNVGYHTKSTTRAHVCDYGSFATVTLNEHEEHQMNPRMTLFVRNKVHAQKIADAINGVEPVWTGVKMPNGWERVLRPQVEDAG